MNPISPAEAKAMRFQPLTRTYAETERYMIAPVIEDLKRGNIHYVTVNVGTGVQVWRQRFGMVIGRKTLKKIRGSNRYENT